MKIWIFEDVQQATNYSDGGSIIVIARDEDQARRMINAEPGVIISEDDWTRVHTYTILQRPESKIMIFPNEGYC